MEYHRSYTLFRLFEGNIIGINYRRLNIISMLAQQEEDKNNTGTNLATVTYVSTFFKSIAKHGTSG